MASHMDMCGNFWGQMLKVGYAKFVKVSRGEPMTTYIKTHIILVQSILNLECDPWRYCRRLISM